ncbi:MAG: FAD-dependent oxidoreductase [Chloroflexi bacterium]|nr:FAD-dependent oxidoreductase [Chloroflexota bacterium]
MSDYDLIIIGGGPAGMTAGLYAARANMKVVLFETKGTGGELNNTDLIEDWPGEESITGFELGEKMRKHAEKFGLAIEISGVKQVWSEGDRKVVELANGTRHSAYAVIVSAGGEPIKLGVPGEQELHGKGVSYCAVCDGAFFRNMDLAVIGGGDSAFQEGLFLTRFAKKLYVVHRRNDFRAQNILQTRLLGMDKVEAVTPAVVTRIGGNGEVKWIEVDRDGKIEKVPVEGVFIFIGFKPVGRHLFTKEHIEHDPNGYLITDQYMRTSIPGVYAVGDTRAQLAKQITTAVGDATTAVLHAERYIEELKHAERAFPEAPREEMPRVAQRMEPVRVEAGQTVVRQGDVSDAFYIVVRGRLGVFKREDDGNERQVNTLGTGEFFGEIGLLAQAPRVASVRALEPSELLRLDQDAFKELVSVSAATRDQLDKVARERLAANSRR